MTEKIDKNRIKLEEIEKTEKTEELEQELRELYNLYFRIESRNEELESESQALKVQLIIALALLFNIGIFQLFKKSWATVLVIAFFEILMILVYARMTGNNIILDLWREIVSMVSKRKNTDEEKNADKERGTDDDTQKPSEKTSN